VVFTQISPQIINSFAFLFLFSELGLQIWLGILEKAVSTLFSPKHFIY
jgi:hypothetical protein